MSSLELSQLSIATWQTIYMIFISSFVSIVLGLLLGVVLFAWSRKQHYENKGFYAVLSIIVNIVRSVPFIILMISIIPLTRLLVGTSIGTNAAIVPLIIGAIPFYARITEAALSEVPKGLIEAGYAMGATYWQIVFRILLPESLPSLIKGATLTIIALTGYTAIAGAVGGGGLGELAIDYGYQQFDTAIMIETVVLLVILVQLIQWWGDRLARVARLKSVGIVAVVLWIACIATQVWPNGTPSYNTVKLGITAGVEQKIMKVAQRVAWQKYHLHIKLITFDDYVLPNEALNNGDIDANLFQHVPYLDAQIKARHFKLSPIARTFVYPMGFYSRKIKSISQLKPGDIVAIPSDPSNQGRALRLLQKAGLIGLKKGVGILGTVQDVTSNPEHLTLKTLAAAQLPRVLQDASLVALTNDFVGPAGFTVNQAIFHEGPHAPYANVLVVRTADKNNPIFKKLIKAIHSKAVLDATYHYFPDGEAIKAYK